MLQSYYFKNILSSMNQILARVKEPVVSRDQDKSFIQFFSVH